MKSYADLTEFMIRYPESEYVDVARERLIFLRNLIASSELDGAEYYLKRGEIFSSQLDDFTLSYKNIFPFFICKLKYFFLKKLSN